MREAVERLERDLTCSICLELLRGTALLPCAHRFCGECCASLGKCPLCQHSFGRRAVLADPLCDALVERARELRRALEQERQEAGEEPAAKRGRRTAEEQRLDALRAQYNASEARRAAAAAAAAAEGWEGPVVLLCTGLDEESQLLAEQLVAQRPRSSLAPDWSPAVTHCVCGTDQVSAALARSTVSADVTLSLSQAGRARRTLKYLCSLASGSRVVGPSWLRAWRAAGRPPAAAPHAAAGDLACQGGPQRAMQEVGERRELVVDLI